jgi:hypothetical protein
MAGEFVDRHAKKEALSIMSEPREIPRLNPPPEGRILYCWCLYEDDRWDGPVPQDYDDEGWLV